MVLTFRYFITISSCQPCPVPNGAAGLHLLGCICRESSRKERAIKYFKMSLQLDPFLWTSFQALAELGVTDCNPAAVFGVAPPAAMDNNMSSTGNNAKTPLQPIETPAALQQHQNASSTFEAGRPNRSVHFDTPGLTPIAMNQSSMPLETPQHHQTPLHNNMAATPQNPMVIRRARDVATRQYYPPSPETPMTHVTRSMRYLKGLGTISNVSQFLKYTENANTDLSAQRHLFMSATGSSENQATNKAATSATASFDDIANGKHDKIHSILELLAILGAAYQRLMQYNCKEALATLQCLPPRQQMTGWVLHQQGRALLEMNDFSAAQRSLEMMQSKDPGRIQGLELLSTVYWQLKMEVELAYLSQKVVDMNRLSPEAWCCVGNCFSLQKDHESALLFFKRSLQLDPDFTYTHTLCGYEYMANEDFDKAIACFRQALRIDERHYNAWYGLGAIFHRQEKFDMAEYHFEKAVAINHSSSVLRCNLGIAQHSNSKSYQALDTLAGAFQLDPRNPQARFQRATIYMSLQRPLEALAELEKVRDAAPREATIHFAMGKVLKRLGRPEEAMKCFLTAMDLDPKDSQMLKGAMDKLDEPDVEEESLTAF
jgi:anaphase-promoting complex subunit 3